MQAIEDNDNSNIIIRAKDNIKKGMKKFPHEENKFLFTNFNIPYICQFTKLFLEYSAGDIFYTAIVGVDVLSRGQLPEVREKSKNKYREYVKYQKELKKAQYARQAYYVRESFTSAIQAQFSKDTATHQIMTYYKILRSFVTLLDNCPNFIKEIISSFNSVITFNNSKSINFEKRSTSKQFTIVQKSDQTQSSHQKELIKVSKPILLNLGNLKISTSNEKITPINETMHSIAQNEKDDSRTIFTKSQEKRLDI